MPRPLALLTLVLLAAACERRQPPDPSAMVRKALAGVMAYPSSSQVSASAGADAAQLTLSTPDSLSRVAGWYRQFLATNGWTLQSDVTTADSIAIVAQKGSRPLWLTLRSNVGAPGTTYTLISAVTDSTADSTTP